MIESANNFQKGWSDIRLQPFVYLVNPERPWFELLSESGHGIVHRSPGLLRYLDNHLPSMHSGQTGVSVSLDADTLRDKSFPEYLLEKARADHIAPSRIQLTIDDGLIPDAEKAMSELARCGFRLMVDRFIADRRFFDVLTNPHVSVIRLDSHLACEMPRSMHACGLVKGLKALADLLDKQLVVAGVETFSQALAFEALGCDTFQGSYYADAIGLDQALAFVRQGQHKVAPTALKPLPH